MRLEDLEDSEQEVICLYWIDSRVRPGTSSNGSILQYKSHLLNPVNESSALIRQSLKIRFKTRMRLTVGQLLNHRQPARTEICMSCESQ